MGKASSTPKGGNSKLKEYLNPNDSLLSQTAGQAVNKYRISTMCTCSTPQIPDPALIQLTSCWLGSPVMKTATKMAHTCIKDILREGLKLQK